MAVLLFPTGAGAPPPPCVECPGPTFHEKFHQPGSGLHSGRADILPERRWRLVVRATRDHIFRRACWCRFKGSKDADADRRSSSHLCWHCIAALSRAGQHAFYFTQGVDIRFHTRRLVTGTPSRSTVKPRTSMPSSILKLRRSSPDALAPFNAPVTEWTINPFAVSIR